MHVCTRGYTCKYVIMHACVCACPGMYKNGVRKGWGLRQEQMESKRTSEEVSAHRERNANICQERESKRGPKGNSTGYQDTRVKA